MIRENLQSVLRQIEGGNNLGEKITLVGATKTMSVGVINQAISCGLNFVAENRVQEFREKTESIIGAKQHFIGHLQTNKVKYLVGKVELIQSVDSIRLAEEISKESIKKGVFQDILIEVNVGGELSKSGFDLANTESAVKEISKLQNVKVRGLMAMLPRSEDQTLLIELMDKMRALYDSLKDEYQFTYLSMGMSSDYLIAIKHGSNMIRLGRTIFGERKYNDGGKI